MTDIVAIFDDQFQQVFTGARPIKASIGEAAKTMDHPTEVGTTVTDHRVILPVEINLSLILSPAEYAQVYNNMRVAFFSGQLYTVQTKTGSYSNMLIAEMPHDEDPELFDTVSLALKMREVRYVSAQFVKLPARKVRRPVQQSTKDRGQQAPKAPAAATQAKSQSILARVFQ